jgi:hypothetical protein
MLVWHSCGIAPQKFDQTQGQAKVCALSLLHSELEKDSDFANVWPSDADRCIVDWMPGHEGRRAMGKEGGCSAAFYG